MKSKMLFKIAIALFVIALSYGSANAQTTEIIIQTTAQCGECKEIIEKALMAEPGVKFAELDVKSKKAKVVYNAKRTEPTKLRTAISLAGYDADEMPADSAAVAKLNPCCTKGGHRE